MSAPLHAPDHHPSRTMNREREVMGYCLEWETQPDDVMDPIARDRKSVEAARRALQAGTGTEEQLRSANDALSRTMQDAYKRSPGCVTANIWRMASIR